MADAQVKRESYFIRFRKRWKRRGVVEIDETHPKYKFTALIRQGIQNSIESFADRKEEPTSDKFSEKQQQKVIGDIDKTHFDLTTYAPAVFESLRSQIGFSSDVYKECICPSTPDAAYLEFVSNSKSGQNFFLSNDKQLMIKTITPNEKRFFLRILQKYIDHLNSYPHSLLVRYLGLYKIIVRRQDPVHFIVMQSILYPDERISVRFDLKACIAGRYTEEQTQPNEVITVLKDVNFGGREIHLGRQRGWFQRQINHDTQFLQDLQVIDYSLLIGIQSLHDEEIKENAELAGIVVRATKSTSKLHGVRRGWPSPTRALSLTDEPTSVQEDTLIQTSSEILNLPGAVEQSKETLPSVENLSSAKNDIQTSQSVESTLASGTCSVTESESLTQNRRLLPHCRNELHVIDGSSRERYFIGIIDFFTPFGVRKRFESLYKVIKYRNSGQTFSTIAPNSYAKRFREFVTSHIS